MVTDETLPAKLCEEAFASIEKAPILGPEEKDERIYPGVLSGFSAEAPSSKLESSTGPEIQSNTGETDLKPHSATRVLAPDTDTEKILTSTVPMQKEKGSTASSSLEKEVDLEAGNGSEDSYKKEPDPMKPGGDPNIVDWDGPDDPKNPINWSEKLKWANIAVIASITFLT